MHSRDNRPNICARDAAIGAARFDGGSAPRTLACWRHIRRLALAACVSTLTTTAAIAQIVNWTPMGPGNWGDANDWSTGVVPNSSTAHARFLLGAADQSVNFNGNFTVGEITLQDDNFLYEISTTNGSVLTLAGLATVTVNSQFQPGGFHRISVPIAGSNGLTKRGVGTLILDSDDSSFYTGETRIQQGMLTLLENGSLGNSALISVAANAGFDVSGAFSGEFEVRNGQTLTGDGTVNFDSLYVSDNGAMHGNLVLRGVGDVQEVYSDGRIAPGNSPGILRIEGDYLQGFDGILEIEVGGLTPGTQHDQLQVSGQAQLDGRLELPIINGFQPVAGQTLDFLTAGQLSGGFHTIVSSNLPNQLAVEVSFPNVGGERRGRLRFVASSNDIQFTSTAATVDWFDLATWTNAGGGADRIPVRTDNIVLSSSRPGGQRVETESMGASPVVNRLTVGGGSQPITLVISDFNEFPQFTSTAGVTIDANGAIELSGDLATSTLRIINGGKLIGDGLVHGNVVIGVDAGANAMLSPGIANDEFNFVGDMGVRGNVVFEPSAETVIDVVDDGFHDTLMMSGDVELGGALTFDLTNAEDVGPGTMIEILTAGSLVGDSKFQVVRTVGSDALKFVPVYDRGDPNSVASSSVVAAIGWTVGDYDMDSVFLPNDPVELAQDAAAFALAFVDPEGYELAEFNTYLMSPEDVGNLNNSMDGFTFDDITEFRGLTGLSSAQMQFYLDRARGVPESSSASLCLAASLGSGWARRSRWCRSCLPRRSRA